LRCLFRRRRAFVPRRRHRATRRRNAKRSKKAVVTRFVSDRATKSVLHIGDARKGGEKGARKSGVEGVGVVVVVGGALLFAHNAAGKKESCGARNQ
jgi:hypothetical protein